VIAWSTAALPTQVRHVATSPQWLMALLHAPLSKLGHEPTFQPIEARVSSLPEPQTWSAPPHFLAMPALSFAAAFAIAVVVVPSGHGPGILLANIASWQRLATLILTCVNLARPFEISRWHATGLASAPRRAEA
jgi:hypothetical protein